MTQIENTLLAVDSLVANEFEIEINGEKMLGVFWVEGLTTFKLTEDGNRVKVPFKLGKMVQRDGNNTFNKWLRATISSANRPRSEIAVVAIDDGVEIRRWTAKGAWIQEVSYSNFDTGASEMVEEMITIYYDELIETWSATTELE